MKESFSQLPLSADSVEGAVVRPQGEKHRERGVSTASLAAFIAGSFLAHGVAYAALSSLPLPASEPVPAQEMSFTVLAPPEPEPVTAATPAPAPLAVAPRVRERRIERPAPKPEATKPPPVDAQAEPPPIQTLGVSSESGLAVAGSVGTATPLAGTSLNGVEGGTGTGPAQPLPSVARVDLRKLTSEWASAVSRAINTRASREYPRSALRAHVQGSVVLSVRIGTSGKVEAVEVARSSGSAQLDDAAVAATLALGEVPAPPEALHRYLRPFPVPVNYVIR